MRTRTRALVVTALLALLVASAGCTDGGSDLDQSDAPSAATIQENVTATMQEVETSSFTMDMTVNAPNGEVTLTADGAMDIPNEKMRMAMEMSAGRNIELTQYVVGDTAYVNANGQWQTQDTSAQNVWEQNNQLQVQQEMLQNSSIEVTGADTVDGNDVWVVSITPDPEDLRTLLAQQGGAAGIGENVEFGNVSVTQYVDADSYHVRQIDMSMNVTMQGQSSSVDMTMTFDGFNEPVSIELPEGAPA